MEDWFQRIVKDEAPGPVPALIRMMLLPTAFLYGSIIEIYKLLFELGVLRRVRLPCRVVSIGNLTMGGVGKTVAVQAAARAIQGAGLRCAILSYGYRAASKDDYSIVSDGEGIRMNPEEAGDEAAMLASLLPGVPVLIGKRRPLSGQAAVRLFNPDVILLDDGFQHWRLHRDRDLVLLDSRKPFGNGRVFPAGLLRERAKSLRRAAACILTRCDAASPQELFQTRERIGRAAPGVPIYETVHQTGAIYMVPTGAASSRRLPAPDARQTWDNAPGAVLVVSGIGQNEAFLASVRHAGWEIGSVLQFANHHAYTAVDVARIIEQARPYAAVITTEKDAIKLASLWPGTPPLAALPVYLEGLRDEQWLELCGVAAR
jgi:tetraacyldisaccharide 4'-kinase